MQLFELIFSLIYGKIREIKIKMMDIVEVKEKKWAMLLVLARMLDYEISEENAILPLILIRGETRKIKKNVTVDDITYEIENNLLEKIVFELQVEGIIHPPLLTHKGYSYSIRNREKIGQRMAELNSMEITLDKIRDRYVKNEAIDNKKRLKSIHLVTKSVAVENVIFLVLDERFEMPIRFDTKNRKGEDTTIKKLHDIAYFVNAPGKRVGYSERLADNINNGIFKKRPIKDYMKTNKFEKPTLVQKSEDGNILVLKNEILIKTMLINAVPTQYQSLYKDKIK
ncbi:MAG: hypothetical protein WC831_01590 [Parcubacteria group bacterium]|jgi:hypothetical protein